MGISLNKHLLAFTLGKIYLWVSLLLGIILQQLFVKADPIKNNGPEYIQNLYIKIQNLYRIYTILQKKILRKFIIKTKIYRKHT